MAIINVNEINEELKKIEDELFVLKEQEYEELEEPEEEKDEYQLAEEARNEEIRWKQQEIYELNMQKRRLERLKGIKEDADAYLSLYPNGYSNVVNGQKDFEVEDLLTRKEEAKTIACKIKSGEVKTAGVFGDWGTGKSTFLGYVEGELNTNNIPTIKIDASEYSDQDKIWAYVYGAICKEFNSKFERKCKLFFSRIVKNWFYVLLNLILSIGVVVFVALPATRGLIEYFIKNTDNKEISMWADTAIIISYVYIYINYALPKIVEINSGFKYVGKWFKKNLFTPNQDEILGYKVQIKKNLDDMLKIWDIRVILLVDELDRCNEDVIVNFFDTIQLFQHSKNMQIVYAVDRKAVDRALVSKGIPGAETENYIKKYIDYRINIYPINKEADTLENIIKQYSFTKIELLCVHTFIQKHLRVNITIRDLKEILNILCEVKAEWLTKYIYTKLYENDENYVISFKKFIPWAIYAMTDSKWVSYMLEDIPTKAAIIQNDDIEMEFNHLISRDGLGEKYSECPKYLRTSRVMDIINYREILAKHKVV